MTPETEVISCPACQHLVRIPADWLGQSVQCPECKATFTAPRRNADGLTDPVLLTAPQSDANAVPPRPAPARAIGISAFLLMLLGIVSLVTNSMTLLEILRDREGFEEAKKQQAVELAKSMGQDPDKLGVGMDASTLIGITAWGVACGLASFGGGVAIAFRRWYWLARVGSVAAILNAAGCCCVPGAFAGIWTTLMLRTEEGRGHFRRQP